MPKDSILLNGSENLNEIVDEGEYYYGWWTDQIANAPVDSAFHLSVRKVSAIEVSQTYTQFTGSDNTSYTRQSAGNRTSWSAWKPLLNTIDLLWENASLGSSFAEQIIWKDCTQYSTFVVVSAVDTTYTDEYETGIFPKCNKMEISHTANNVANKRRRYVSFMDDRIYFTHAYNQSAVENNAIIPYRIYGIRMGVGTL
jgi:hypothetical protein